MTLMAYFNSLRELGGARRIVEDEVLNRVADYGRRVRVGEKEGLFANRPRVRAPRELTSRVSTNEVAETKRLLELSFQDKECVDVALATNMISVGLDITRLGLMLVLGQPKAAAEYIQATSRVGRSKDSPGLVCTVFNWARPRDLSHYETFEHYHATFYQHVEALSVTPFAPRALDRGLAGVLVSLLRLTDSRLNPNSGAQEMDPSSDQVAHLVQRVVERARAVTGRDEVASLVQAMALSRLGSWRRRIEKLTGGTRLGYKSRPDGQTLNLLEPAGEGPWTEMTILHSLREVEPTVNLVLAGEMDDDPRVPGDVEGA